MQWSVRPFVRITLFYILGILIGNNYHFMGLNTLLSTFLLVIAVHVIFLLTIFFTSYTHRWLVGIVFYTVIFSFGIFMAKSSNVIPDTLGTIDQDAFYLGEVIEDRVETDKSVRLLMRAYILNDSSVNRPVLVLSYLKKSKESRALGYGDRLLFNGRIKRVKNANNPEEFDYATFLARKGIYYTVYLNEDQWSFVENRPNNKLIYWAISLRNYLLIQLNETSLFNRSNELAAAILLGYDNLMDPETEDKFVRAGAMHILCVSGLHVGVIFMLLSYLLKFMRTKLILRVIRSVILMFSVWAFALITGLSPSVQRAAIMISFFILGQLSKRQKDNYNTLATSAFCMLLIDPQLIFSTGFQLSYAAVFGILSIYRPLYNLVYFKNKIIDYFWAIMCVSIAAQLATFPIATHYFNFFPNYFMLTNLLIIPLSFAIIIAGFVYFMFSWIPFVSTLLGWATSFLVYLLSLVVNGVNQLPYGGMDAIYMPELKIVLVYFIIYFFFQFMVMKKVLMLKWLLMFLLLLMIGNLFKNLEGGASGIIVYNAKRSTVIDIMDNRSSFLISDSSFLFNENNREYIIKSKHMKERIKDVQLVNMKEYNYFSEGNVFLDGSFLFANQKKYFILQSIDSLVKSDNSKKMHFDAVIVSSLRGFKLEKLRESISFDKIILSSSIYFSGALEIASECKGLGIECYTVSKEGACIDK